MRSVCVCVCVCVCACVCMCVCLCVRAYMCACVCTCMCMCRCMCVCACMCVRACICVYVRTRYHIKFYFYAYNCVSIHTYIRTQMYLICDVIRNYINLVRKPINRVWAIEFCGFNLSRLSTQIISFYRPTVKHGIPEFRLGIPDALFVR